MRQGGIAGLLILAALAAPAFAQSQDGCLPPLIAIPASPWIFDPREPAATIVQIENPNGPPVETVSVSLDVTYPEGWSAVLAQREISMGPNNVTVVGLSMSAPARGVGATEGNITVSAAAACVTGSLITPRVTSATSIHVTLAPASAPWFSIVVAIAGVLILTILYFALRVRRGGVRVVCDESEKDVPPSRAVSFPLLVQNRNSRPIVVELAPPDVPKGWSAHLAVAELALEPRREQELWLLVRAPATAKVGEELTLRVRARAKGEDAPATETPLKVRVTASRG